MHPVNGKTHLVDTMYAETADIMVILLELQEFRGGWSFVLALTTYGLHRSPCWPNYNTEGPCQIRYQRCNPIVRQRMHHSGNDNTLCNDREGEDHYTLRGKPRM